MINVLLVDNHEVVRLGVAHALKNHDDIHIIATASSAEEAIDKVKENAPDVVVMALEMTGMSGIDAISLLRELVPKLKVIIMAFIQDREIAIQAFDKGVDGFITKSSSSAEFALAVQAVGRGGLYLAQSLAQEVALSKSQTVESSSMFYMLSERELQIARLIAEGESVSSVAAALHISPSTVHTYKGRIFEKLEVNNVAELTRLAIHHGEVPE